MNTWIAAVLVLSLATWRVAADSTVPEWILGTWQSGRAAFGNDPPNYCLLTVTPDALSWATYPKEQPYTASYKVVASNVDFVVAEVQKEQRGPSGCKRLPSPAYLRFDRKDFFHCIQGARRDGRPIAACPNAFASNQAFELTVFRTLDDALEVSNNPASWSAYWQYEG